MKHNKIQKNALYCLAVAALLGARLGAAGDGAPLLSLRFNDASSVEFLLGGMLGAEGSGVSGKAEDRSYMGTAKGWKHGKPGAVARMASVPEFNNLNEITITGWYKLNSEGKDAMTMLNCGICTLIWDQPKAQWVLRVEGTRPVDPEVHVSTYRFMSGKGVLGSWGRTHEWIFLAVTWKCSESRAVFYHGTAHEAVTRARDSTRQDEMEPLNDPARKPVFVGNTSGHNVRPMDACIDNVRIFGKALGWEAIESIRQSDLKNEEVTGL